MAMTKEEKAVRQSLLDQLKAKNIDTEYTRSRVGNYMDSWRTVKKLTADIEKRGVQVEHIMNNGSHTMKINESINARQKENGTMDKILQTLGLNAPVIVKADDGESYL